MSETFCGYDGNRDEMIVAYVYGELATTERIAFTRHLSRCTACRSEIDALGDVRAELATWSPPELSAPVFVPAVLPMASGQSALRVLPRLPAAPLAAGTRPAWREIPAWAQFAAAMLFMGMAAGLANLDVSYNHDGVSLRTGWSRHDVARAEPASAVAPAATQADLMALEQRLRDELQTAAQATSAPVLTGLSDPELVRRVRAMIKDSEQRQQRELALRVAEVAQDAQVQRQADLVRIDRTLGALQSTTGTAVRRQEQLLNSLAVRVSQKQ